VLRASRQFGPDLERIVREYRSDTFGFASRNFYTEFLAVREILGHPGKYLDAPVKIDAPVRLKSLVLPRPATAPRLAQLLRTEVERLAAVNPAWTRKAVGQGGLAGRHRDLAPVWDTDSIGEIDEQLRVAAATTPEPAPARKAKPAPGQCFIACAPAIPSERSPAARRQPDCTATPERNPRGQGSHPCGSGG
jgi:membrane-bound lytic murein transglycosylase D